MREQDELIDFMFRRSGDRLDVDACLQLWFGKGHEVDQEIRQRFSGRVQNAFDGELDHWMSTPRGCLALMILVDQFPRNIYRHTAQMYEGEPRALALLERFDWVAELPPEHQLFLPCLILTHSESLDHQQACVAHYERIESSLDPSLHIFRRIFTEHLKIIQICGVFPHRDHFFGRQTSEEGRMLLQDSSLRFDLPLVSEGGSVRFGNSAEKLWRTLDKNFDILERLDEIRRQPKGLTGMKIPDFILGKRQLSVYRDVFKQYDTDGDNHLSVADLQRVLESVGRNYDPQGLRDIVRRISGGRTEEGVDFDEFSTVITSELRSTWEQRIERRFEIFDTDGSGTIDRDDLAWCLHNLDELVTPAEVDAMIAEVDTNQDGLIDYEKFLALFRRLKESSTDTAGGAPDA